jgi:hypothetical protein
MATFQLVIPLPLAVCAPILCCRLLGGVLVQRLGIDDFEGVRGVVMYVKELREDVQQNVSTFSCCRRAR